MAPHPNKRVVYYRTNVAKKDAGTSTSIPPSSANQDTKNLHVLNLEFSNGEAGCSNPQEHGESYRQEECKQTEVDRNKNTLHKGPTKKEISRNGREVVIMKNNHYKSNLMTHRSVSQDSS